MIIVQRNEDPDKYHDHLTVPQRMAKSNSLTTLNTSQSPIHSSRNPVRAPPEICQRPSAMGLI